MRYIPAKLSCPKAGATECFIAVFFWCRISLEHIKDSGNALRQLAGCLKSGGSRLIFLFALHQGCTALCGCLGMCAKEVGWQCPGWASTLSVIAECGLHAGGGAAQSRLHGSEQAGVATGLFSSYLCGHGREVRDQVLAQDLLSPAMWYQGVADLKTAAERGTFLYSFFRATAQSPLP